MISVEEAQEKIIRTLCPLPTERVALDAADGRVLAEPVYAQDDMPPFDNSSMDGFAVQAGDTARAESLRVRFTVAAGHVANQSIGTGEAARIMTGAPVPTGADAVIQVEWTHPDANDPDRVWIDRPVNPGQNVRRRGEDMRQGAGVLSPGETVTPPLIGILATLGRTAIEVYRRPRVAIIATGDELIDPGEPLRPGTIRNSNSYALAAAAARAGADPRILPPGPDRMDAIERLLDEAFAQSDVVVSSGGVSVGEFDFVKDALSRRGTLNFWRVRMKPGKPVVFGEIEGKPFFGLPGNPVSALVTFELFARPALRVMQGDHTWPRLLLNLPLADPFADVSDRRQYVRVRLQQTPDRGLVVRPNPSQESNIQTSWSQAKALMVVEENHGPWAAGESVPVLLLD